MNSFLRKSALPAPQLQRLSLSDGNQVEEMASSLGVTVDALLDAVNEVGTWIPAIERRFSAANIYSTIRRR